MWLLSEGAWVGHWGLCNPPLGLALHPLPGHPIRPAQPTRPTPSQAKRSRPRPVDSPRTVTFLSHLPIRHPPLPAWRSGPRGRACGAVYACERGAVRVLVTRGPGARRDGAADAQRHATARSRSNAIALAVPARRVRVACLTHHCRPTAEVSRPSNRPRACARVSGELRCAPDRSIDRRPPPDFV